MDREAAYFVVRHEGDVTIVRLKTANLTGIVDVNQISTELSAMVNGGCRKLVLDMKNVQFMGSAGLGMMLALTQSLRSRQGRLVISHPENIIELLKVSRTTRLFETAADPRAAVELLSGK